MEDGDPHLSRQHVALLHDGTRCLLEDLSGQGTFVAGQPMRIAPSTVPVTILGESGTGKELVARARMSARRARGSPSSPSTARRCRPQ